jgi:hypothetical protein
MIKESMHAGNQTQNWLKQIQTQASKIAYSVNIRPYLHYVVAGMRTHTCMNKYRTAYHNNRFWSRRPIVYITASITSQTGGNTRWNFKENDFFSIFILTPS